MKYVKLFAFAVALFIMAGGVMASQTKGSTSATSTKATTKTTASTAVHHEMGTISSLTSNELTLDHTWKGKEEKTKFTLESSTKKEGNIAQGDHVTVYYHLDNGQRVATEVKALGTKPAKS
jgi:Domain of unknown function (DUF5666)